MNIFIQGHFIIGVVFFVLFLLTGAYMIVNFPELYVGREEVRMMYRATHIYILMSALMNLMAGCYLFYAKHESFIFLRKVSSVLILITPILFFIAFIFEPPDYLIDRPISFWAVIFMVAGVTLHAMLNLKFLHRNK